MKIKNNRKGFTLAEMLMTVAIILILAGVSFVGVISYLRHLKQLENDGIAKEIFIAAQNHLSMASSQGFLGRDESKFGTAEDKDKGIYYFVVNGIPNDDRVLSLMLPFASIDETVRNGGSYIIRYQKNPAIVRDVFYASKTGRFNHTFNNSTGIYDNDSEYKDLIANYTGDSKKSARRNYGSDNSVIGYYGGAGLDESSAVLKLPTLKIINKEKLEVEITNPIENTSIKGIQLKLIVTGKTSGNSAAITLFKKDNASDNSVTSIDLSDSNLATDKKGTRFTIILDDITIQDNHFYDLFGKANSNVELSKDNDNSSPYLNPGEDIDIKVIAFSNSIIVNIAESAVSTTNSLFADDSSVDTNMAAIANIRHLENLSNEISEIGKNNTTTKKIEIKTANQISDLSWEDFKGATSVSEKMNIYSVSSPVKSSKDNTFMPVNPTYSLDYQGQGRKITGISINNSENAGLFGTLLGGSKVSDVELIDFSIISEGSNTGSLAGLATKADDGTGVTIKNVLVHNDTSKDDSSLNIVGTGNTGGLVGTMNGGTITACAAAVYVKSEATAGGLVGVSTDVTINHSYSGGHTDGSGKYTESATDRERGRINVISSSTSGTAGGFAGSISGGSVTACYSTCSVLGKTEGGFAGSVSNNAKISNSYATGLVKWSKSSGESGSTSGGGSTSPLEGAFIGSGVAGGTDNHYFEIMNEGLKAVGGSDPTGVSALDSSLKDYNIFFGNANTAVAYPYDNTLMLENRGKYYYPAVDKLGTLSTDGMTEPIFVQSHYGDWCSPETLVINTGTNSQSSGSGN